MNNCGNYGWGSSSSPLGKVLKTPADPGVFAPWFENGKLPEQTRSRFDVLRKEFRLDDVAIIPSSFELKLRPVAHGKIALLGSPRALMALLRNYTGTNWWRVLAQVGGQHVPYEFYATGGRSDCSGCGQWQHIEHVPGQSGIVDWMEFDDFIPQALEDGAGAQVRDQNGEMLFEVTVIPRPGGPTAPWYSVRGGKWMEPQGEWEWDHCQVFGTGKYGDASGPVRVVLPNGIPVHIAHAMRDGALGDMVKCGGLLWPSFAVSWRVHGWGESQIYFFLDVSVLERNLSPTASRSTRDKTFYLANTDTWTPTVKDLEKSKAEAEKELRGEQDMRGSWLDVLGPDPKGGREVEGSSYLKTWSALGTRMKRLRGIHGDEWVKLEEGEVRQEADHYPYLELKIADRVDVNSCPLVVYVANTGEAALFSRMAENTLRHDLGYRGAFVATQAYGKIRRDTSLDDAERARAIGAHMALDKWLEEHPDRVVQAPRTGRTLGGLSEVDTLRRIE